MTPIEPTPTQILDLEAEGGVPLVPVTIGGPHEGSDVIPCPALISADRTLVHVRWQLDEIELAALAQGGSLWLTTWGGLPVHRLEVRR